MGQSSHSEQRAEGAAVAQTAADLAALGRMTGAELAQKYLVLFGQPARSRNKDFLRKRLAWRIQELAEGGLSERALARIEELGADALAARRRPARTKAPTSPGVPSEGAARDLRIPPVGTVVTRLHGTKEHSVTVLDDGFEYQGERYRSLSKIARVITGTPWNGYLFFFGRAKGTKPMPGAARTMRRGRTVSSKVPPPTRRCAIYTRKSTSVGLEQDFNSLDAQREACVAYIERQPGWTLVDERYDDGGFTGANTERPAFQKLLTDIDAGKIDVVVVYKVDRLSRSLLDFAKLMERFGQAGASFVSVTQNFSTADAMGRLTLNMLMSFAEFEREMIGERTRDKIAAARRKGKWTGGTVPLGYTVKEKRLVVNEPEAVLVREIFALYLEQRSALSVARLLNGSHRPIAPRRAENGTLRQARPWTKGDVLSVIKNPIYAGYMRSHGELYEGEHEALVDRETFSRTRALLDGARTTTNDPSRNPNYILRGLLRCACCGSAITPASTRKGRTEYRYYRCIRKDREGREACPSSPLPAGAIETYVIERLREFAAKRNLADAVENGTSWVARCLADFDGVWDVLTPENRGRLLRAVIQSVEVDEPANRVKVLIVDVGDGRSVPPKAVSQEVLA